MFCLVTPAQNILPTLWSHQQKALRIARKKLALFFDTGCGKTRTVVSLIEQNTTDNNHKTIIVAPLTVCRNWLQELHKYSTAPISAVFLVAGQSATKKVETIELFLNYKAEHPAYLIINTECFRSSTYTTLLAKAKVKFFVIDESHNFKTATSKQTRGILTVTHKVQPQYLYLLSGTPAPQGEIDLWSTLYLLGETTLPFYVWRRKYFEDKNTRWAGRAGYYPDFQITKKGKLEVQEQLSRCSIVARKNEVLDLPPLVKTKVYCDLSPQQKKHYETMKEFLFAIDSDGNELNAANVLTRTLRMQQIVGGYLDDIEIKDNERLKALEYVISTIPKDAQFIIWTIFKPTYTAISKVLSESGIGHDLLTGEVSSEKRFEIINDFQSGKVRALIGHPKACGVGINLTSASYMIYYLKSYNLVDDMQSEARNYRGGSEVHDNVTRIDIIANNTIDEEIDAALESKLQAQEFVLRLQKKYA